MLHSLILQHITIQTAVTINIVLLIQLPNLDGPLATSTKATSSLILGLPISDAVTMSKPSHGTFRNNKHY